MTNDHQYPRIGLYIDGQWIHNRSPHTHVSNPADEAQLAPVPRATTADLDAALSSALEGFRLWRATSPEERAAVLRKAVLLIRERTESIATTISLELGKPISDSRAEVLRACTMMEWDAAEAQRLYGRILPSAPGSQHMVLRQPIGPVAAFTPWNAPLASPARKVGAALAAGCSVILKAAEETPGAACAFVQCLVDAGLPSGVLNLVFGDPSEISAHLIASPVIRMITFTGSISVGKHLTRLAAAEMKPVLMELGGHAPVLVCDGVDAEAVGKMAAVAKVRMAGQICVSPTRFLVHESVYDTFVKSMAQSVAAVKVGGPFTDGVQMGPVANGRRLAATESLVDDAVSCGGRVAAGGRRLFDKGYFYAPTVLADVPLEARAMREEPFGPLALCRPFSSLTEAIEIANQLPVGLAGYAFTNDLSDAETLGRELECGILSVNHFSSSTASMPFGGLKESGIGREGGQESLDAYTVTRMVYQRTSRV